MVENMQVTGEISAGAIGLIMTVLAGIISWWVKSDRQSTKFDVLLAQMRVDIETNRTAFSSQLVEMKSDQKALAKSIDEVKLQLASISAQQNMSHMFSNLPGELARAMGELRGRRFQRENDEAA